jgi:hypothetical protein
MRARDAHLSIVSEIEGLKQATATAVLILLGKLAERVEQILARELV